MGGEPRQAGPQLPPPSDADDIRTIIRYLGLIPSSEATQRITGLTAPAIKAALTRGRPVEPAARIHLQTVANVIERLAAARAAATGSRDRPMPAALWLELAAVETSRGRVSPIDILADQELCDELLADLMR
jgi:hypothetical protein